MSTNFGYGDGAAGRDYNATLYWQDITITANSHVDIYGDNNYASSNGNSNIGNGGRDDSINLSSGDALWLNNSSDTQVEAQPGNIVFLGNYGTQDNFVGGSGFTAVASYYGMVFSIEGDGQQGKDVVIKANADSIYLLDGTHADVYGDNNDVTSGWIDDHGQSICSIDENIGIWGGGNTVVMSSGSNLWLNPGSSGTNVENNSHGDLVFVYTGVQANLSGSGYTVIDNPGGAYLNVLDNSSISFGGNGVAGATISVTASWSAPLN